MVMDFAASVPVNLYVDVVAPVMAVPERYHWYFRVTGVGDHVPAVAVNVDPTIVVPVILGTGVALNCRVLFTVIVVSVLKDPELPMESANG